MKPFLGGFFGSAVGFVILFMVAYYLGVTYPQYGQSVLSKVGLGS